MQSLMRRFTHLEDAQRARDRLIAGGVAESDVELRSLADEAGAEKSNFAVGDGRTATMSEDAYERNFKDVRSPAANLLVVRTDDAQLHARIARMLDEMGGYPAGRP